MTQYLIIFILNLFCTAWGSSRPLPMAPSNQTKEYNFEGIEDSGPGNWYEKLHWWREAKRLYTIDIQAAMEHVKGIAKSYEEKKKSFFEQLEKAQKSLPVTPQQALPRIKALLEELAAKQEQRPEDTESLADQQKKLEALQQGFEHFSVLSQRVEEAYAKVLTEQVKAAENYEEKALESFEKIEEVYDDRKAHEYYLVVENGLENIQAIIEYLSGPFYMFTEQTGARVIQLAPQIKTSLEALEQQGVYIRVLSEAEKAEKEAEEKKKKEAQLKKEAQKKEEAAKKARPWWRSLFDSVVSFFGSIGNYLTSWFSSAPQKSPPAKQTTTPLKQASPQKIVPQKPVTQK